MAHETCPYCSFVAEDINEAVMKKKLREHIEKEHKQSYRRASSWRKCSHCGGSGKLWGLTCKFCGGSGVE